MAVSQTKTPDISVIIINYQTWETTLQLLKTLGQHDRVEILVIDNGPDDALRVPLTTAFPSVNYIRMEKNVGYAVGVNKGIKNARGEWIMVLNNDMEASAAKIIDLMEKTKNQRMLVAAPRLIKSSGDIQDNIGYFDSWKKHVINGLFARPRLINASELKEPTKVDLATGGAVLFHKKVIEQIGEWDSRFFMYFEDIDFGLRLKKAGIPVLYVPSVELMHLRSFTANRNPKQKIKNYTQARAKYIIKHRGIFMKWVNDIMNFY